MAEQELTPDLARKMFGLPAPTPDQNAIAPATGEQQPATPAEPDESPSNDGDSEPDVEPLDDDRAELQRRYDLSVEDARSIRGADWAEMSDDAERLRGLAEANAVRVAAREHLRGLQHPDNPNRYMARLFAETPKQQQDREWLEQVHRPRAEGSE